MSTAMQERPAQQANPLVQLRDVLERSRDKFAQVAPKHMTPDRLVRLMLAACSRNPLLMECSTQSVLQFCMKCAETGLEPIGAGGAWPIPFKNKKAGTVELQFVPDYRGLINCAKHAGAVIDVYPEVVREHDEFAYTLGLEPSMTHVPARRDRGELEAAYCVVIMPGQKDSGATFATLHKRFVVMTREDVLHIRDQHSKAWQAWIQWKRPGPWNTDEPEMWKKTVVRRAMKLFAGLSASLDAAMEADDQIEPEAQTQAPIQMPRAVDEVTSPLELPKEQGQPEPAPLEKPADDIGNQKASPELFAEIEKECMRTGTGPEAVNKLAAQAGAKRYKIATIVQAERMLAELQGLPDKG